MFAGPYSGPKWPKNENILETHSFTVEKPFRETNSKNGNFCESLNIRISYTQLGPKWPKMNQKKRKIIILNFFDF